MPYDLEKQQWYNFDFHSLISKCKDIDFLSPFHNHFDKWEAILVDLNSKLHKDVSENKSEIFGYAFENHIFQFPFKFFSSQGYIYQFNITALIKALYQSNNEVKITPLELFQCSDSKHEGMYQYSYIDEVNSDFLIDDPIIIASFPSGNIRGIVVDGNHRISAFKKSNRKQINSIALLPKNLTSFGTPLDQGMYLFYNEVQMFYFYNSYPPEFLLNNSLLNFLG